MKLILCEKCEDVIKLLRKERTCSCGLSGGKYLDNLYAEIHGPCIPIGFNNFSLVKSIRNQPEDGMGERFEAFIIPKKCPTIEVKDVNVEEKL